MRSQRKALSKKKVLIVDDEVPMARAIERVLKRHGYDTAIAPDGFRAHTLLHSFSPSVMTLDLKMPGLGGTDVIRMIRALDEFKELKILVISALPKSEMQLAVQAGADDMLEKPFQNARLLAKISSLLR